MAKNNSDPRKEIERVIKIHARQMTSLTVIAEVADLSKTAQRSLRVAYDKTFEAKIAALHAIAAVETDRFEALRQQAGDDGLGGG